MCGSLARRSKHMRPNTSPRHFTTPAHPSPRKSNSSKCTITSRGDAGEADDAGRGRFVKPPGWTRWVFQEHERSAERRAPYGAEAHDVLVRSLLWECGGGGLHA